MLRGARRRLILSQSPSAKVHDMDSIVAHLAVAGGPEPMPFVVQLLSHERRPGSGTTPEIVVYRGGQRRWCAHGADAVASAKHQRMTVTNGAKLAAAQVVKDLAQQRAGTILSSDLDHP